jgi:hypothetical protein
MRKIKLSFFKISENIQELLHAPLKDLSTEKNYCASKYFKMMMKKILLSFLLYFFLKK